jgi:hypothetical protein
MLKAAPWVSWNPVEGALALFDARDGSYHALNESAADIWRGLAEGDAPDTVAARLAARHGISAEQLAGDVAGFVDAALAKGLLVAENAA